MVYFSQGGTTRRVAEHVATGLRREGQVVDLCNLKDDVPPDLLGYDALGVGFPVYYFRPPFSVSGYLDRLPALSRMPFFVFSLYGTYPGDAGVRVFEVLSRKEGRCIGFFCSPGEDYFLPYLHRGYLFSPDCPRDDRLDAAEAFGITLANRFEGETVVEPVTPSKLPMVYRLERALTNRWLARHLYSRFFRVDKDMCTACGQCRRVCPVGNIREDTDGCPVWGRDCIMCLYCEMKCPGEAIRSAVSWPVFRPFISYNVSHASRDPLVHVKRVVHRAGRTESL